MLHRVITLIFTTSLAVALGAGFSTPAHAQAEDDEARGPEEVIVSARKREENVMEIPLSVSVFDADLIESARLNSLDDLSQLTPGFKLNNAFGRQADRPVIRGLSAVTTGIELAGFFVDGIYVSGSLESYDLDSIERVEIIKGPQSAVFGRRTLTGAVNYITKRPSEDTEVRIKGEWGSNGYNVATISASDTIGKFGYRSTVRWYRYDGDFDNELVGGPPVSGEDTLSFNGSFEFSPSDSTSFLLNLVYADDEDDQYPIFLQRSSENNCTFGTREYFCGTFDGDQPITLGGILDPGQYGTDRDRARSSLRMSHDFNEFVQLELTGAYNKENYYAGQDQSFGGLQTAFSFATFGFGPATDWHTLNTRETEDVSFEAWLRGTAMGDQLNWALGAYYYDEESMGLSFNGLGEDRTETREEISNTAYMGSLEYAFNDKFTAAVELRFAEDEIDPMLDVAPGGESFDSTTYRVTGSYFVNDRTMLYGNISTGVLPGGFNNDPRLPDDLIPIDEQELEQIEFGIKSDIGDRVTLTAAAYVMEWREQRRSEFIIVDGTPVSFNSNQGTTDINGFEANVNWDATDFWNLNFGITMNDTEINDFISTDATDVAITGDGDISGAQLPLSPELEWVANAVYTRDTASGIEFSARFDLAYQDSRFVRTVNQAETGDATVLNMSFGWARDNWSVRVWGKNLTQEDAPVSALRYIEADSFFFGGRAFAITPRPGMEWGITGSVTL
ncbi:MAG: TonB-dependent receptor [Gammaproteobacteria bacterium]